jgi:amino acid transporter
MKGLMNRLRAFAHDRRGEIGGLFKTIVLLAVLIPVGFSIFYGVSTTGWSTNVTLLWGFIPVLILIAAIWGLVKTLGK